MTIGYHVPTVADEDGRRCFGLFSSATALLHYSSIRDKPTVIRLISAVGREIIEPKISQYPHDRLIGVHINEIYAVLEQSTSLAELRQTLDRQEDEAVVVRRLQITKEAADELTKRLKQHGIIITDVIIPDFNFPRKTIDHIQDVFLMKIKKATEILDVGVDVNRALVVVAEASKVGQKVSLLEAYVMVRGLDIKEIIADNSGPIGALINSLARKFDSEINAQTQKMFFMCESSK